MTTYEIRIVAGDQEAVKGGFISPGDLGTEFAAIGREAALSGDGTLQIQTRALEDGGQRPLSPVEEAAMRAGMDQEPGIDYREEAI